jgi:hypothetical protein
MTGRRLRRALPLVSPPAAFRAALWQELAIGVAATGRGRTTDPTRRSRSTTKARPAGTTPESRATAGG